MKNKRERRNNINSINNNYNCNIDTSSSYHKDSDCFRNL